MKPNCCSYYTNFLFTCSLLLTAAVAGCRTGAVHAGAGRETVYTLSLVENSDKALIDRDHPGSAGIRNGYEGGGVIMNGKELHLFVTEEMAGWDGTRTGHWKSVDGENWVRTGTVQEPVNIPSDPRHAIWSPMPVYNEKEGRWNFFYVGYEASGTHHGRVFRAVSEKKGPEGLDGPYKDQAGTVLSYTDSLKNTWEGSQGTDSFYPYRAGKKWMAFYGSSDEAAHWNIGLATADNLEGPWTRVYSPPVFQRAENPVVTRLADGTFFAVYDDLTQLSANDRIGYAWSVDGIRWEHSFLAIPLPSWTRNIRTPQSLISAGKDQYWIYFTGQGSGGFDRIGRIRVTIGK